jgi:hypothetical protein
MKHYQLIGFKIKGKNLMNTFINAKSSILQAGTDLYTTPVNVQSIVHALYISNVVGTVSHATISVGGINLIKGSAIDINGSLVFDKPINLPAGESLNITADDGDNEIEAFASVMEISAPVL